ncbi:glycosyltransferase family 2 protein [Chryseosolibacter indicus]|uniref:Glycosyltransferase family 2 protein n=1 Tax=Chryseosolibacter indicus TaxID=2782351 RepID=A0ABS5VPQ1_9BACT|nr:glycosyltransferase family 2 protein [Chryseosolibacter indicus]
MSPLVTVVCLCYNHEKFVKEAIHSVIDQTYKNIQVIIIDDASIDGSAAIIKQIINNHPTIQFIQLNENIGNCRAFNRSLPYIKGDFVIDFATDDVMLRQRIEQQVKHFSLLDKSYGVVFTDSIYIDEKGNYIRSHYTYLKDKGLLHTVPEGDVYQQILSTYFISSPTMISRKEVFDCLQGYDERLSYEDFDFWVRSSRKFKYSFLNEITTKVRISVRSMSRGWYIPGDKQLYSTYLVCKKAQVLNKNNQDHEALAKRLRYEIRQSVFSENRKEAENFYALLHEINRDDVMSTFVMLLNRLKLPLSGIRRLYHKLKYGK